MTFARRLSLIAAVLALFGAYHSAEARQVTVNVPGTFVHVDEEGTVVETPDADVQTQQQSAVPMPSGVLAAEGVARSSNSYANAELSGMDFSHQNLVGADFTNATLTNVNFTGTNLRGANFTNADLTNANLTNANFTEANLTNATLDRAVAVNTRFDGALLVNVDMSVLVQEPQPQQVVVVQTPALAQPRPVFVDSMVIGSALKIDPAHPSEPRKIDLTINFDFNSDKLTAQGVHQVEAIAAALKSDDLRAARIVIEGHTDNVGTDAYNDKLSYRRASTVLRALVDQYGIASGELTAKGLGETQPIASNDDDLGRAMNRRVTLVNVGR